MIITITLETTPDAPKDIKEEIIKLLEQEHPWLPGWVFKYVTPVTVAS